MQEVVAQAVDEQVPCHFYNAGFLRDHIRNGNGFPFGFHSPAAVDAKSGSL
jgi:hypothetical protein